MTRTSQEQYAIELINRARLDPLGEPGRLGINDPSVVSAMDLPNTGVGPLAPNDDLLDAATGHSQWMLDTDTFSHTGANGSSAGQRMSDAGYEFAGYWSWGENIAYRGSSGALNIDASVAAMHSSLFQSDGHRANILNGRFHEIGVGLVQGDYRGYNALMETQNFATTQGRNFLTGVVYDDQDGNDFYSVGEGTGGVRFAIGSDGTTSQQAGGYALELSQSGAQQVTITVGATVYRVEVVAGSDNVKLDLVDGDTVLSSADMALLGDTSLNAGFLGVGDLDLVGNAADNVLTGNDGDNLLTGAGGDDTIDGGGGEDTAHTHVALAGIEVVYAAGGVWITSEQGTDFYTNIEYFSFQDGTYSMAELGDLVSDPSPETAEPEPDPDPEPGEDAPQETSPVPLSTQGLILGTMASEGIPGTSGDDIIVGLGGNDRLPGGDGNDQIYGGTGHDRLGGGNGNDLLDGGAGNDSGGAGGGDDTILAGDGNDLLSAGAGHDSMSGGEGHDRLAGSFGIDTISGGTGNDTIGGGYGWDLIDGGAGDDRIGAGFHDDTVYGGSGDDYIGGGEGDDLLVGDAGNDTLNGGLGDDILNGGAGADMFVFNALSSGGADVIQDFDPGSDVIRLVGLRGVDSFDRIDLQATSEGVEISYGHHIVLVEGISLGQLDAEDFLLS